MSHTAEGQKFPNEVWAVVVPPKGHWRGKTCSRLFSLACPCTSHHLPSLCVCLQMTPSYWMRAALGDFMLGWLLLSRFHLQTMSHSEILGLGLQCLFSRGHNSTPNTSMWSMASGTVSLRPQKCNSTLAHCFNSPGIGYQAPGSILIMLDRDVQSE